MTLSMAEVPRHLFDAIFSQLFNKKKNQNMRNSASWWLIASRKVEKRSIDIKSRCIVFTTQGPQGGYLLW